MKIALVIERFEPRRGGRERSTEQIARGLAARGHEVTVLCQRGRECEGVAVEPLATMGLGRAAKLRSFVQAVQRRTGGGAFDVVHAMLPVPGANVYQPRGGTVPAQQEAGLRRRDPLSRALAAATEPLRKHRAAMADLERQVMGDAGTACLAVSRMVAEEFREHYNREHGVRVVYNAVDVPNWSEEQRADHRQRLRYRLEVEPETPVFITVATNFELKGVQESIAAFAEWFHRDPTRKDARLIVIGREMIEGYQRAAGLRDVGRMVQFLAPTDEVFPWYCAADACVLLSWYDPCSRVVLEAARWGLPSVTTIFNGAAEVLAGGAGIVVSSPRDKRAVAAALDELSDPARRAARRERCAALDERLGMDRHIEELLVTYEEVRR